MNSVHKNWLKIGLVLVGLALAITAGVYAAGTIFWTEASPGATSRELGPTLPGSLAPLAEKASPAVVTVYTKRKMVGNNPFFGPMSFTQEGEGSGFILSADGYILTNNHVVEKSDVIKVVVGVKQKKDYDARLIGADPEIDVALIKIEAAGLPVLPLGDSDAVRVGDWAAAIGSPFNFTHTFTVGVVSAKGRRLGIGNYDDFIQTDASINAGNSGGPLLNLRGEVVGMNTLIISPMGGGGNVGIGFSTPINLIKMILPQLKESGKVTRSWMGVTIEPVSEEAAKAAGLDHAYGARVVQVVIGGPADKAGIDVGDIILEINGRRVEDSAQMPKLIASLGVGVEVPVSWRHQGQTINKNVALEKKPEEKDLAKLKTRGGASMTNPLGVAVRDLSADDRDALNLPNAAGVLVVAVANGSPAQMNGIEPGDLIIKINMMEIKTANDFNKAVAGLRPGSMVRINLRRDNASLLRMFTMPGR